MSAGTALVCGAVALLVIGFAVLAVLFDWWKKAATADAAPVPTISSPFGPVMAGLVAPPTAAAELPPLPADWSTSGAVSGLQQEYARQVAR